jgi:hypothetical protein
MELAEDGVHVGVFSPGFVATPLRDKVLGPDGQPYTSPPALPFRLWPLERCVDRLVRLILRRQNQAMLPGFIGPLLALEQLFGGRAGDRVLLRRFQACNRPNPDAS